MVALSVFIKIRVALYSYFKLIARGFDEMKKALFVYNPKAGKAGIVGCLSDVLDTITKRGYEITIYPTQCQGDGEVKVKEREDIYDRIICSGGDGTLDEIVTGMMNSSKKLPVGYIPAGSTNDFARSVNIPRDMREAASVAAGDNIFKCDIGKFNDRFFVYVAAFGMFTDVTYETDQNLKNMFGYAAYVAEAVKRIQSIKAVPLTIKYDDEVIQDNFIVGMVSNSNSIGGLRTLPGPDVSLNDGRFEVLLIKEPNDIFEMNSIVPAIFDRKIKSECVISFKCDSISIVSDEPIAWTLDGEFGGNVTKAEINNLHEAFDIVVP